MIQNTSRGITLVEIMVVIFIIALFSTILVSNFPKIQRRFALSRATYKLAQDLRKTQDLGLSGVELSDANGQLITVKGYGVYINLSDAPTGQYIIYADVPGLPDAEGVRTGDQKYSGDLSYPSCDKVDQGNPIINPLTTDCVIEKIDVSEADPSLYIDGVENIIGSQTSINFSPPNPIITIDNLAHNFSEIGIILRLNSDSSAERKVFINTAGLINVE